jgi:hypothetical protein
VLLDWPEELRISSSSVKGEDGWLCADGLWRLSGVHFVISGYTFLALVRLTACLIPVLSSLSLAGVPLRVCLVHFPPFSLWCTTDSGFCLSCMSAVSASHMLPLPTVYPEIAIPINY